MSNIEQLSKAQLVAVFNQIEQVEGVRFVSDKYGILDKGVKLLYNHVVGKYASFIPEEFFKLRPMTFGDVIFLPWPIDTDKVSALGKIKVALHEAKHAVRIRDYPGRTAQWYQEYFTDFEFRALEEGSAEETEFALLYWLYGKIPQLELKKYYLLTEEATRKATKAYAAYAKQLQHLGRGSSTDKATAQTIRLLKAIGVTPQ